MRLIWLVLTGAVAVLPVVAGPLEELVPRPVRAEAWKGSAAVAAGYPVKVVRGNVAGAPAAVADQAYVLEVAPDGAAVTAGGAAGERFARVTLAQLAKLGGGKAPCCRIVDWPAMKWRGFMLDCGRNWQPLAALKDVLDFMAAYKMNLYHWHLTDYFGWRLESKRRPEMTSDRATERQKGCYYTQSQFREIVDYAAARGITVMPELDLPGHTRALRTALGVKTMRDPGVREAVAELIDELCSLEPPERMPFVHLGTDEVRSDAEKVPELQMWEWAEHVVKDGRAVVGWAPGIKLRTNNGRFIEMQWGDRLGPDNNEFEYFDMTRRYIDILDPFENLGVAAYLKPLRWNTPAKLKLGALLCAWHDDTLGDRPLDLYRNNAVFPSIASNADTFWCDREKDHSEFRARLPSAKDPLLALATELERRLVAQRDKVIGADFRYPFHFVAQTHMRWRLNWADTGELIADDIPQAFIQPYYFKYPENCFIGKVYTNRTVTAETWIRSPDDRELGVWIGFTSFSRSSGRAVSGPTPAKWQWNRYGATVELNGTRVPPPDWARPGVAPEPDVIWYLDKLSNEMPFIDEEYYMRPPMRLRFKKGWNHVKLTMPAPEDKACSYWSGAFVPILGTSDHPREVPDLEYRSSPSAGN